MHVILMPVTQDGAITHVTHAIGSNSKPFLCSTTVHGSLVHRVGRHVVDL